MDTMDVEDIPQTTRLTNDQVENSAGGFVYAIDNMQRLRRFLCLGSEGGTYYIGEKELGIENAKAVLELIKAGRGEEVVAEVKKFSLEGRTSKQNPIMFVLALCAKSDHLPTKQAAYKALADVCRIPTHLFMFLKYAHALGQGWGRAQRNAVSAWYTTQNPSKLAMAITKYQNREGYTHRDVLRLSHPKTTNPLLRFLFVYITKGFEKAIESLQTAPTTAETTTDTTIDSNADTSTHTSKQNDDGMEEEINEKITTTAELQAFLAAVEEAKKSTNEQELIESIKKFHLVREHMPTTVLNSVGIWTALLEKMPMTAMIRNLGKMSEIHLLTENSDAEKQIVQRLNDQQQLRRARIHPFNLLVALETYKRGKGVKGKLTWTVNEKVKQALESAFYLSFKFVEKTNKRFCLGLDVSGSMSGAQILGSPTIDAAVGSCAMCMVTVRTEPYTKVVAFSHELVPVTITKDQTLEKVMDITRAIPMGGTDCALPMIWALDHKEDIDVFIIYTDSETWFGGIHPTEALKKYRTKMNKPEAKLIVCGMTATQFSIADPNDGGMLDIAGFDSAAPQIISQFALGLI
ncbi:unnamed protein product [Didymodactylos carnosus]|uniref:TROVE domain-containing protein n=1 Tax=Didymodactylos carnosus TaxID=1234261 RepID=A0A813TKI0_9BILA|nr:unnamed protein product [Didymodactylos carnosus]CAF0829884.1 unnamed protein product [Didymodactylos carnosus]CAF3596301.1 unnamed protein product [Didymodactylos carnosus]CAF3614379.1 unnamed protein product [Didymodactylos carnosus]